ncbi:hypothetical protein, partial [Yokenella regensburgei]|uniref:hypothetical protein n=1 Tax=Yokenella regensburgei TaxID=158877 RepID=UPI003EDA1FEA
HDLPVLGLYWRTLHCAGWKRSLMTWQADHPPVSPRENPGRLCLPPVVTAPAVQQQTAMANNASDNSCAAEF